MRIPSWFVAALLAAGITGGIASPALGDSDPASDTLIAGDVFYPYTPVSKNVEGQLNGLVKKAKQDGYPVKVALIGSVDDLGGVGNLYGQPQQYAEFLASEISFNQKQRLIVVMPQGVGVANAAGKEADAARGAVKEVGEGDSDGLAEVAMRAVAAMAGAAGHDVPLPKGIASGGGGGGGGLSGGSIAIFLVPVLLLLLALFLARLKQREEDADAEEATSTEGAAVTDEAAE